MEKPGSRESLAGEMKGKTIVVVTEPRYMKNESAIFSSRARQLGASENSKVIPYDELFTDPEGVEADILILRPTRFETTHMGEIIRSLAWFREHHPQSAVIVCIVGMTAFIEISKSGTAHVLDERNLDYPLLLKKGAEVLGRLQGPQ